MHQMGPESSTLVGYGRGNCPLGKRHDDNCRKALFRCRNGHLRTISYRNTCPCGWKGKLTCFCHKGDKIER
jgi:hypothetical protein